MMRSATDRLTTPILLRTLACAVVALALLLPAVPVRAAEPPSAIVQVGAIESRMLVARRHLDIDPTARRLFEIGQVEGQRGMRVDAFDLDSFKRAGSVLVTGSQSGVGGFMSAVDELRHRLYVLYPVAHADDGTVRDTLGMGIGEGIIDEVARVFFGVAVIDTMRMRMLGSATIALAQPAVPQDRAQGNFVGIKAMSYFRDGGKDLLYLATELPSGFGNLVASLHSVTLHQIDASRLLDPDVPSAVDWSYPVPQCPLVMARDTPGVVFRSAVTGTVSVACRQGGAQGLIAGQPAETPGIVQVTPAPGSRPGDTSKFTTVFRPVSGNLQYGVVAVDPYEERIFLQIDGSTTEAGIWVFDVRRSSFVGLISLPTEFAQGGTYALATNPARSRVYSLSRPDPERLLSTVLVAATDSESDQGSVTWLKPEPALAKLRAVADPLRHRIVVPSSDGAVVLEDRIPLRHKAGAAEPDEGTIDVAEGEHTAANFVGGTQAYGARVRFVGGSRGVDRNVNTYFENPPSELSPNTGGITPPPPAEGTRDVHFARVVHATLSNGESSAKATGAERDLENTDADLGGWTNYVRRWGGPDLSAERWPYPSVDCTDFGNAGDKGADRQYGAAVTCSTRGRKTDALAVDESMSQAGMLRFTQSRARSVIARDAKRGVVAIAESEVTGIDFGGAAGIGRVVARAESWATGRPRSSNGVGAGSRFTRVFENVWVLAPDGTRRSVCTDACSPESVRDAVNGALGFRARVDVPVPEPIRAAGTPGGFESLIVRDPFERANEAAVNQEADERRLEVPALVVTVFADGRVPSRVVISLAGVSTEAHYGIFLVSQSVPFRPIGGSGRGGDDTLSPGGGGDSGSPDGGGSGGPVGRLLRKTLAGIRFAFSSPARAVRVAGVFLFLAAPLLLAMRRRTSGGEPRSR